MSGSNHIQPDNQFVYRLISAKCDEVTEDFRKQSDGSWIVLGSAGVDDLYESRASACPHAEFPESRFDVTGSCQPK